MSYSCRIIRLFLVCYFACFSISMAEESKLRAADGAGLFSAEQADFIGQYHQKLLEVYDIDYRVLTIADESDINLFANKQFSDMKVGSLSKTGRGLLLVINPKQNLVRLEVSKGLEPVYTDAFVSYIEHRQIIPFFKASQVANGVLATSELVFARAADAVAGKAFDETAMIGSAGGGAANKANIGAGMEAKSSQPLESQTEGATPNEVVDSYLAAMKARNSNPDLPIFSEDSKQMMRSWVVTPAQMDMLSGTYAKCKLEKTIISEQRGRAVVRYYSPDRLCSPFFLVKENGNWKLDLTMMQKAIRFNHMNQWHFDMNAKHDYEFAFVDWSFDKNGYPTAKKLRWGMSWQSFSEPTSKQLFSVVTWVKKDSFAEKTGLKVGDIILKWNDSALPDFSTIQKLIDMADEGTPYSITLQRGTAQVTLTGKSPPRS